MDNDSRELLRLALPLILSNLSIAGLGIVDTAVIGHLESAHYLGGVAVGSIIFSFLYWGCGFLRMGTTGLAAQRYGSGDSRGVRVVLEQALVLAGLLALLVLLAQQFLLQAALYLVRPEADVATEAGRYYAIRIWSAPAAFANFVLLGWFLGMQNGRIPLYLAVFANSINILLDLLFVTVFDWRVAGVAWASLIAEYSALGIAMLFLQRLLGAYPASMSVREIFDGVALRRILSINRDIFLRTLCLIFVFVFFNAQSARMGTVILAANTVLLNFQLLTAHALDGLAFAAEALVGRQIGARDPERLLAVVKKAWKWSAGFAVCFSCIYLLGGGFFIQFMTGIPAVLATANQYLPWAVLLPVLSVGGFLMDGVFVGAMWAKEMRDTMLWALCGLFLPAWYFSREWDNHGLWAAFSLFMLGRGISMYWVFRRRGFGTEFMV